MLQSVCQDFLRIKNVSIRLLQDGRIETPIAESSSDRVQIQKVMNQREEQQLFQQACEQADAALVIAPEFENQLLQRVCWAEAADIKLLGPGSEFVQLTSDKWELFQYLGRHNVPAVPTFLMSDPAWKTNIKPPLVVKPREGAGSQAIEIVEQSDDSMISDIAGNDEQIVQPLVEGTSISVSAILSPTEVMLLPPAEQLVDRKNNYQYLGSHWRLTKKQQRIAREVVKEAIAVLPKSIGYVGFDLICDEADCQIIEINPRLTTSYVGLSHLSQQNLAQAMLDAASAKKIELNFKAIDYQFLLKQ